MFDGSDLDMRSLALSTAVPGLGMRPPRIHAGIFAFRMQELRRIRQRETEDYSGIFNIERLITERYEALPIVLALSHTHPTSRELVEMQIWDGFVAVFGMEMWTT